MERSEPLAGASRGISAVPNIDPRAGGQGQAECRACRYGKVWIMSMISSR